MMLWIADAIINAVNSKLTSKCVNLSNLTESHHLSDYLVYKWYDDEYEIFLADEHVGFIIETAPLVGNSESMQNELSNIFTQVLPEGASIQTMLFADKNIGDILNRYSLLRKSSSDSLFFLAKKRTDYLKQITLQHDLFPYVLRDFRCYMSIVLDITGGVDDAISQIVEIKKQIIATLSVVGVSYLSMNADDLVNLLRSIFNMKLDNVAEQYKQWNAFDLIQNQIIDNDTDFKVEDDLITLENHGTEIKTFCIEGYPPEWSLYQMSELIGDIYRDSRQMPFPFIFHYGVYIPKQANYLSKIALKANIVEKQLYSPIGKYIPDIEREYAELQYTQKCVSKGERLVRSYFGIILFSPIGKMASAEQTLRTIFSSLLFKVESNISTHLHALLSMMPMMWNRNTISMLDEFKKLRTTISTESSNLVPQQGEWKGTRTPAILLGGRRGQLMQFCPFDNETGNYNVTVVGRSGAGKSVFMQELMTSTIGLGGKVFVLDVGRSFEKICYMLEGQFIEFRNNIKICLNPFSSFDVSNREFIDDSLAMLKSVIQMMAAPINGVTDKGAALLEQATNESFLRCGNSTTITDIANYLLNLDDDLAGDLGKMLYPYTANGVYGKYFNGVSNINFNSNLIVIELEELKEKKELQSVIVQMLIINITNKMFLGDRKTPFSIVFDEAWDLMRAKQSSVFIETLARRLRKYKGSLVVGTQSVNDFYSCPGAQAAWDNSDWNCFLSQKAESIVQLKKSDRIFLDSEKEALLKSVKTIHGKYAEVLVNGTDGYAVGKLLLDPFSSMLFSTKPEDYSTIKELHNNGMSIHQAIEHILCMRNK